MQAGCSLQSELGHVFWDLLDLAILRPLRVRSATSDAPHFRGLTGGVYKAQEHIHRGMLTRDY